SLYVCIRENEVCGSIIIDDKQPSEYGNICWSRWCGDKEVMVIHLLMVRPSMSGKGIAASLVKYAIELAESNSCKALRLDTGSQNIPAVSLYRKMGFEIVATAPMKVGDVIAHDNHLFLEKILRENNSD
ncbi:MAG: GNAT family N-acetyltransferase, partial [Oscillospiraceae bacterium]|nr:GNAT family N-acetyltransferase [Oscillospiraceae bacterium]